MTLLYMETLDDIHRWLDARPYISMAADVAAFKAECEPVDSVLMREAWLDGDEHLIEFLTACGLDPCDHGHMVLPLSMAITGCVSSGMCDERMLKTYPGIIDVKILDRYNDMELLATCLLGGYTAFAKRLRELGADPRTTKAIIPNGVYREALAEWHLHARHDGWRPSIHDEAPKSWRSAMSTLLILARAT